MQQRHTENAPVNVVLVRQAPRHDPVLSRIVEFVKSGWLLTVQDCSFSHGGRVATLTVEADVLLWGIRVVVPQLLRGRVLELLHIS